MPGGAVVSLSPSPVTTPNQDKSGSRKFSPPRRRSAPTAGIISSNGGDGGLEGGRKAQNKIKRPLNAFMVWSKLQRRQIMDNDPTVHHSIISKQLGAGWKSLTELERRPFYEEAQRLG